MITIFCYKISMTLVTIDEIAISVITNARVVMDKTPHNRCRCIIRFIYPTLVVSLFCDKKIS